MRQIVDKSDSKTSTSCLAVQDKFVGKYARLRIPRSAKRHTKEQLSKAANSLDRWNFPPVVLGNKGEVLAGFAQAQLVNLSLFGHSIWTAKYSEMTDRNVRDYIRWMKKIARLGKWDRQMIAIELQNLQSRK